MTVKYTVWLPAGYRTAVEESNLEDKDAWDKLLRDTVRDAAIDVKTQIVRGESIGLDGSPMKISKKILDGVRMGSSPKSPKRPKFIPPDWEPSEITVGGKIPEYIEYAGRLMMMRAPHLKKANITTVAECLQVHMQNTLDAKVTAIIKEEFSDA